MNLLKSNYEKFMNWYRWEGNDLVLNLLIQPRSCKNEFVGQQGDTYKICTTAPPVDGRANEQLLRFLAKAFGVRNCNVQLIMGVNSRRKAIRISSPTLLPIPVQRINDEDET